MKSIIISVIIAFVINDIKLINDGTYIYSATASNKLNYTIMSSVKYNCGDTIYHRLSIDTNAYTNK